MNFISKLKRFLLPLLILIAVVGTQPARASHFSAADIWVDYIGTGPTDRKYVVWMDLYSFCEVGQSPLPGSVSICYQSASCNTQIFQWTLPQLGVEDTLDQLCVGVNAPPNSCNDVTSIYPGFKWRRYMDTIVLPQACSDWRFWWRSCCRNSGIENIPGAGGAGTHVECGLNNLARYDNSTPRYVIRPIPYICVNVPAVYLNGPSDPDNDSMRTFAILPQEGPNGTTACAGAEVDIAYGPAPLSLANPINSTAGNPYAINVSTATATFTPQTQGEYVLTFQTTEYDRFSGIQMGYTQRDVTVAVLPCSGLPPDITDTVTGVTGGGDSTALNEITVCPGESVNFAVNASSNSISNIVNLNMFHSIPPPNQPSFNVVGQGTANVNGTFSWTPNADQIGDHTIIFEAADSTCSNNQPIVLKSYLVVLIKVLPSITASNDTAFCPPNGLPPRLGVAGPPNLNLPWTWTVLPGGSPLSTLDCTTCDSPWAKPTVTTDYVVSTQSSVQLCRSADTVRVTVYPNQTFTAGPDQDICLNDTVILQGFISPAPQLQYEWITGEQFLLDSSLLQPKAFPIAPTDFVLAGSDGNGCVYRDTVRINVTGVRPFVSVLAGRDTVCPNGGTQLYSVVTQQSCGLATGLCIGGTPTDRTVGFDNLTAVQQSPFYTATGTAGHFLQLLYRREELEAVGMRAGYINSIAFDVKTKTSTATFPKYAVYMGCTAETDLTAPSSASPLVAIPGLVPVYQGDYTTTAGWNTITFPVPYYWDGVSNLAVQLCLSKRYNLNQGTTDTVYASNTEAGFEAARFLTANYTPPAANLTDTFSFCADTSSRAQASSVLRPNIRFNVCSGSDYNYAWTPASNLDDPSSTSPVISGLQNGTTYTLTVTSASNANCFTTANTTVEVDRSNSVEATPGDDPFILCRPDYVQLSANGVGPKPIFNPACGIGEPIAGPADSAFVGTGTASNFPTVSPYYGQNHRTSRMQMLIRRNELIDAGVRPGTLRSLSFFVAGAPASGTFNNFRISLRCTDAQSLSTTEGFQSAAAAVYAPASPVTTVAGWNEYVFTSPYNWDSSKNLIVEICYANAALNSANQLVEFSNTGFPSMLRVVNGTGNACATTPAGSQTILESRRPNMRFRFTAARDTDFVYTWYPGTYLSDSSIQSPVAYVPRTSKWYVVTQGRNNCQVSDSVTIYVPEHNYGLLPRDTIVCYGEMLKLPVTGDGKTFEWYQNGFEPAQNLSCTDCSTPVVTALATTTYTVIVKDSVNCADTFYSLIRVKPLPTVDILQRDTTVKFGQSVVLRVTGADSYYWTPAASLSAAIGTTVIATPRENTKYIVSGIATSGPSIGCRNLDSVTIRVDPSDNLFVPSAFSPNGDGVNDVFRVANLTFQRLMEFRVFNRYGQEIYSTTDHRKGWDGTWKGVRQDMGTYQYMIRVAFPDGVVETYKGDVTLVR